MDRVRLGKARSIERCIERVREEYAGHEEEFETNYSRQDAAVLNLLRACEQAIDMGNRMIRLRRLPPPDQAREIFAVLHRTGLLDRALADSRMRMVGFRNVAGHAYQKLDLHKVRTIIETRLEDFTAFAGVMLAADPTEEPGRIL
jgi:uncharacterized protein YutE (UPF0331/DUF86 family)